MYSADPKKFPTYIQSTELHSSHSRIKVNVNLPERVHPPTRRVCTVCPPNEKIVSALLHFVWTPRLKWTLRHADNERMKEAN